MGKPKLTESELEQLKKFEMQRDEVYKILGRVTYEFLSHSLNSLTTIQKLMQEQSSLGKLLLQSKGFDVEKQNYTIDFKTGEIIEVK